MSLLRRIFASLLILGLFPLLSFTALIIWISDRGSPFYTSRRVGKDGVLFSLYKFRSMYIGADKTGVDTTIEGDARVTPIGEILRRCKIDELPQLFNIVRGDMHFTGPRPNVVREVERYTEEEKRLLSVPPGLTDLASVVFSDLGMILEASSDPNLDYNQRIRPWKSRLGLLYVDNRGIMLKLSILLLTFLSFFSRRTALRLTSSLVLKLGGTNELISVCQRECSPPQFPPPGSSRIVQL